jgi:GAF domain-containing protein
VAVDREAFTRSMRVLGALDPATDGLAVALQHVSDAARTLFGVDGAGLLLLDQGRLQWVSVTDQRGRLLEDLHADGRGPCLDAIDAGLPVDSPDLAADDRWPGVPGSAGQRLGALLAVPVPVLEEMGQETVRGVLSVFASEPRSWDEEDREAAAAYAAVVGDLLQAAMGAIKVGQLERALASRVLIEQAKGALMGIEAVSADEAFEQLRSAARSARVPLVEVAGGVLDAVQEQDAAARSPAGPAAQAHGGGDERLAFLTGAGTTLAASLDAQAVLERLVELAAGRLGDLAAALTPEAGRLGVRAAVAVDPVVAVRVRAELDAVLAAGPVGPVELAHRDARAVAVPLPDGSGKALLEPLGAAAALVLPVVGRAELHAVLVVARTGAEAPADGWDVELAEHLARQAGTVLDTARRFGVGADLAAEGAG